MRSILVFLSLCAVAASAFAQTGRGPEVLNAHVAALHGAQSLKATYSVQLVGSAPTIFHVELAKPNRARIDTPTQLIVADGKQIVTYDKTAKTYFRQPQTDAELKALFAAQDLSVWLPFFDQGAYSRANQVRHTGTRTRGGVQTDSVQMNVGPTRSVTLHIGQQDRLMRIAELVADNHGAKETTLLNASVLELNQQPGGDTFAFTAPEGARELTLAELEAGKWYTDLEEARQVAGRTNRLLMVDFYADW
jgi:outer membrane lipoprotein-sorting protein